MKGLFRNVCKFDVNIRYRRRCVEPTWSNIKFAEQSVMSNPIPVSIEYVDIHWDMNYMKGQVGPPHCALI